MKRLIVGIGILVLVLVLAVTVALRASLPILEGEQLLVGLTAPVSVTRDDLGIPTLKGRTRLDE
jgi:penicillin amidase